MLEIAREGEKEEPETKYKVGKSYWQQAFGAKNILEAQSRTHVSQGWEGSKVEFHEIVQILVFRPNDKPRKSHMEH